MHSYASEIFNKLVSRGWLNSLILRHKTERWQTSFDRQKWVRPSIPRVFFVRTLNVLQTHGRGGLCDLVFNLDEIGLSELEDRKSTSASSGLT
jgi:hypothetical protein